MRDTESLPKKTPAEGAAPEKLPYRTPLPEFSYPEELPVSARRDEIMHSLMRHQVIVISGETGSGKTTQLPKICLDCGRGRRGLIGHTQPRRIAAAATARRIAKELNTPLGQTAGFKVRFTDKTSPGAWIKLMTDGILLAETQHDRLLTQYDTIIIDEAHERSLNIDFLIGYIKEILPKRPDLKVIITSATIDSERFAKHFSRPGETVPVIEVSGRLYPVEVRYRPILENRPEEAPDASPKDRMDRRQQRDLMDAIRDAAGELAREGSGDILVFLPGEREIRDAADVLRRSQPQHVEILPLFARLSAEEQERIFKPTNAKRIILATNVAETSLTVPGIRFVIDSGLARVKRYSYRNKVEQLHIEPVSQASASQRAGRCGRVASGICIRLYDEADFEGRPPYTDPEIRRSSLASVILQMMALKLGDIESFPFLEPPLKRAIADGYQLLQELGALDEKNAMTPVGKELSRLPLDPRIGRMLLAARDRQCLKEMLVIASALSVQDPRERPMDAQEAASNAHQKFADSRSEFLGYLKLWKWFSDAIENKTSNRQLRDKCRENFLSFLRLREWRDIHAQLLSIVSERNWRINTIDATYEELHKALLTGLLGNIGLKTEDASVFLGARGIRFQIWPGSTFSKKAGKWLMASELVDTARLYARCAAKIEPEWVEEAASKLLKKSWSDPHWEKRAAQVTAFEKATLYGLPVYSQRRIHYGAIAPAEAREIFIREALVAGNYETKLPFFPHNQKLVREIEVLEHKSRRTDVLIDDTLMAEFYARQIPETVFNGASFEKWYRDASKDHPKLLFLTKEELMRHEAAGITTDLFPKTMAVSGIDMGLSYYFEPGNPKDGVTLSVPIYALNQLEKPPFDWLVAGMIKEKVRLLLKSLPQRIRRHLVPLPDYAAAFSERARDAGITGKKPLIDALISDIREETGIPVKREDFREETLPPHLFMNFKVTDEYGRMLEMSRNLPALKEAFGRQARDEFQKLAALTVKKASRPETPPGRASAGKTGSPPAAPVPAERKITEWDFEPLPELLEIMKGGTSLIGYPALTDKGDHCTIEVFDEPEAAKAAHRAGLMRLFSLQIRDQLKYLGKNIRDLAQMGMLFSKIGTAEELKDEIVSAAMDAAFLSGPLPDSRASFEKRKDEGRARIGLLVNEVSRTVWDILLEYQAVLRKLPAVKAHPEAMEDISSQMAALLTKRFITENPLDRLKHFPRYLKAAQVRIDKCRNDPKRDRMLSENWNAAALPYRRFLKGRKTFAKDPKLAEYRWLLEELRVSLFAQELKTPFPVSVKRLLKVWDASGRT